jgi:uncharacterized protein
MRAGELVARGLCRSALCLVARGLCRSALCLVARGLCRSALCLVAGWSSLAAAVDVPYMSGRVVDNAEILSPAARRDIDAKLAAHEAKTTDQIAVLTVPSLQGESVEQFATAVFDVWKLGRSNRDNGVLVLVCPPERRLRIEVGYGLEGTLTDVGASRIIRNVITPRFKDNDFDRGLAEGVDAIVGTLEGTSAPVSGSAAPLPAKANTLEVDVPDMPWTQRLLIGAFIFGMLGIFTIVGVMTPGIGWFLYLFLIPFWAMFPMVVVGSRGALGLLAVYLVGYPVAKLVVKRQPWYATAAKQLRSKGSATIGGFTVSTGSSGYSSGGSSDSGGGGGGGSSGGGGASGGW